ncbi:MAG TPA: HAMP domain-containing sensor histidine kinase [Solirubrobacteraceae bacterium]|nr:HAMP domain-containing sensor histidine kinase [Solirubrobacteraceae bacterium]
MIELALAIGWAFALAALAAAVWVAFELRRRSEAVACAAHELRRPLTAARLGLHGVDDSGSRSRVRVTAIDAELGRATAALADLEAARNGLRAPDRRDQIVVGELLEEAADSWRPLARLLGSDLRLEPPPAQAVVHGDRARLMQACGNLVANALEHGAGTVRLRGQLTSRRVRIEVLDAGPGLGAPVAELAARARGRRRSNGRGLAITSEIARRHGGRLVAAHGATAGVAGVVLDLPAVPGPTQGR